MDEEEKQLIDYRVGDTYSGSKIKFIHFQSDEALVVESRDRSIQWAASDGKINGHITSAVNEFCLHEKDIQDNDVHDKVYVHALLIAITKGSKQAIEYIQKVVPEHVAEYKRTLKSHYLFRCLAIVIPFELTGLAVYLVDQYQPQLHLSVISELFTYSMVGAIGGFASVYTGLEKLDPEKLMNRFNATMNSLARFTIAVGFGIVGALAVKSGIILTKYAETYPSIVLVAAAAAGYVESFVPNLLNHLGKGKATKAGKDT